MTETLKNIKNFLYEFYKIWITIPSNYCRWMKNIDPKNKVFFSEYKKFFILTPTLSE